MKHLDRSSLGMLLIAMGVALLGIAFVLLHLVSPSDGARLDPGQTVWSTRGVLLTPLQEGSSALHPNDLLIAIDGTHVEALARNLFEPTISYPGSRWQFGALSHSCRPGSGDTLSCSPEHWAYRCSPDTLRWRSLRSLHWLVMCRCDSSSVRSICRRLRAARGG